MKDLCSCMNLQPISSWSQHCCSRVYGMPHDKGYGYHWAFPPPVPDWCLFSVGAESWYAWHKQSTWELVPLKPCHMARRVLCDTTMLLDSLSLWMGSAHIPWFALFFSVSNRDRLLIKNDIITLLLARCRQSTY